MVRTENYSIKSLTRDPKLCSHEINEICVPPKGALCDRANANIIDINFVQPNLPNSFIKLDKGITYGLYIEQ